MAFLLGNSFFRQNRALLKIANLFSGGWFEGWNSHDQVTELLTTKARRHEENLSARRNPKLLKGSLSWQPDTA
jgi:hypothetical protein